MKKIFLIILLFMLVAQTVYGAPPGGQSPVISLSAEDSIIGQKTIITIRLDIGIDENTPADPGLQLSTTAEIDFGDGSPIIQIGCATNCERTIEHTYTTLGTKTIDIYSENLFGGNSHNTTIIITPAPPSVCGNNTVEAGESCDDGNVISGDGCDSNCNTELGPSGPVTPTVSNDFNPLEVDTFGGLIFSVINFIFFAGMIALPLCIIAGGFLITMSASPNSVMNGKKLILYSSVIFGIIIIIKIMSYFFKETLTFH